MKTINNGGLWYFEGVMLTRDEYLRIKAIKSKEG